MQSCGFKGADRMINKLLDWASLTLVSCFYAKLSYLPDGYRFIYLKYRLESGIDFLLSFTIVFPKMVSHFFL